MLGSKANASAARHRWFTKPSKPEGCTSKAAANLRSPASSKSAEPRSVASWPKRNLDSDGLTQACRKDTKDYPRLAAPGFKRMHVSAQEVLHRLIEEELQIQSPGIGKRHHEAGQGSFGAAHHHIAEVRPVDLSLLSDRKSV